MDELTSSSDFDDEHHPITIAGVGDTVIRFGKHKGDSFEEVRLQDPGYCSWVKGLSECDGQMREFKEYLEPYFFSTSFRTMRRRRRAPPSHMELDSRIAAPSSSQKKHKAVMAPDHTEVQHDALAKDGEPTCIVCLENRRNCVILPCAHMHYCVDCSRRLVHGPTGMELKMRGEVTCPECRVEVKKIQRVHL